MSRRVKEFIEVRDFQSLDTLIQQLTEIRDQLPSEAGAEMRMRGDDVFGRKLTISYFREQTAEEAACDARYSDAYLETRERQLAQLQEELAGVERPHRHGRLRAVA